MGSESNHASGTTALAGGTDNSNTEIIRRKSAFASRQSGSRAASGSFKVKFDDIEEDSSQTPNHAAPQKRDSLREGYDTPLDTGAFAIDPFRDPTTPLRSGNHFTYPSSGFEKLITPRSAVAWKQNASILEPTCMDRRGSIAEDATCPTDQSSYHTNVRKMRRALEAQLNAVWLTEIIGDIIIKYYQGQREELVTALTQATITAEQYGLKVLMARAQLWKALIFDDTGNTSSISDILVDIFSLIRDHGDEMDCYHLRKLFPYYGEQVWQHLMKETEIKRHDSNATFTSEASQGAFRAWFNRQLSALDQRYNRLVWPDPLVARNAALAPSRLSKIGLNLTSTNTSGNTTLIQHVMRLEDELSNEKEDNQRKLQELRDENNRLKAMQSTGDATASQTALPLAIDTRPVVKDSVSISPGRVTAMLEELKMAGPRPRRTPKSSEKSAYSANTKTKMWVEGKGEDSASSVVGSDNEPQGHPFATPTAVESRYDYKTPGSLSSVLGPESSPVIFSARPQPLRIWNPRQETTISNGDGSRQGVARSRASSPTQRLSINRNAPPHTPQDLGPSYDTPVAPIKKQQTNPMANKESYNFASPSVPRAQPRRNFSAISPLTIDPRFELPSTDTPSPTKLRNAFPNLEQQQEQRRRSSTVLASPDSTSYETERRRSRLFAGRIAEFHHQNKGFNFESVTHDKKQENAASTNSEHQPLTIVVLVSPPSSKAPSEQVTSELTAYPPNGNNSAPIISSPLRRASHIGDGEAYPEADSKSIQSKDIKLPRVPDIQDIAHRRPSKTPDLHSTPPHSIDRVNMEGSKPARTSVGTADPHTGSLDSDGKPKHLPARLSNLLAELEYDYLPSDHAQSERSSSSTSLLVGPLKLPTITRSAGVLSELRSALEAQQYTAQPDPSPTFIQSSHSNEVEYIVDRTINPNNNTKIEEDEDEESHIVSRNISLHTPPHPHETTFASDIYTSNASTTKSTSSKESAKSAVSEARTENYDLNEDQVLETLLPRTYVPGSTPPSSKEVSPAQSAQSTSTDKSEEL